MTAPSQRRQVAAALIALLVLCTWPWLPLLHQEPANYDGIRWLTHATPYNPNWLQWCLGQAQFAIGYRPVTGLSFALVWLPSGLAPTLHRTVDIGCHLAVVALVAAVHTRLFPRAPPWTRLVPAAMVAAHPMVEDVVCYLECRSYSLGAALVLLAVVLAPGARRWRAVGIGALAAAGLLSNEVSGALLPLAGVAAFKRDGSEGLRGLLPAAIPLILAIGLRTAIVGGAGGYEVPLDERWARAGPIVATTLQGALTGTFAASTTATITGLSAMALLVALGGVLPLVARADRALVGLTALVPAYGVVYALTGVLFERQLYTVVIAAALLVGGVVAVGALRHRWWQAAIGVGLAGLAIHDSPLWTGPDPARADAWALQDRMIDDLLAAMRAAPESTWVEAVLPIDRRGSEVPRFGAGLRSNRNTPAWTRSIARWVRARADRPTVGLDVYALYELDEPAPVPTPERDAVRLAPGASYIRGTARDQFSTRRRPRDGARLAPPSRAKPRLLYLDDGVTGRVVSELPAGL